MPSCIILDGGLGHLLKQWGVQIPGLSYDQQFLAGLIANEAAPETVKRAHQAYITAGCGCITTNNFVATVHSLSKLQRQENAVNLAELAGQLAQQAVQESGKDVLVAGSLPPLRESYQTTDLPSPSQMVEEYRQLATALAPSVNVFLAETLSTAAEAQAALEATAHLGKPVWVSFTLEDSTHCCLRSKEPLAAAVQDLAQHKHLAAVLVNCCAPGAVTAALPVLKQNVQPGARVGCYANGFQTTTTQWVTGSDKRLLETNPDYYGPDGIITPQAYLAYAQAWREAGADIIGGCCGVGPEHMQLVAQHVAIGAT